jgi:nicotinate-nucleotide--dimethylbenzimidazole phosphoribosyltransferase
VTALLEVGADVGWPDADASATARLAPTRSRRLAEIVEWLAATQGRFPPQRPQRVRCVLLGPAGAAAAELASGYDIGVRSLELDGDPHTAFAQGLEAADREIDEGADLLVLAGRDETSAPGALTSLLSDTEPVALLPRGANALDTEQWVAAAEELRDSRREIAALRGRPDDLVAGTGSPVIAAAAGFALRAAARRTGVLLDGAAVLAAALLCIDSQPLAREWWQLADTAADPVHIVIAAQLELQPLLDLGLTTGDGVAGLLAVEVVRAVAEAGVTDG